MALNWYGEERMADIRKDMRARIFRAGAECVRFCRDRMAGQPTRGKRPNMRGMNPSAPGQFPKRVTQDLARGIDHEVYPNGMGGRWGTQVKHGVILELTTDWPRWRPWMTRTNTGMRARLRAILGGRFA